MRVRSGFSHFVDQFTKEGVFVKRWNSCTTAAKYFKTSQGNISNAARGERNFAQGFIIENENENEVWREHPVHGFRVSNIGRVEINNTVRSFGQAEYNGYKRIRISTPKGRKNFVVHRLIAETFLAVEKATKDIECDGKSQVNHIDHNRSNNNINNLEWVTPSENIFHRWRK